MEFDIQIERLEKSFGPQKAVDGLDLQVERGELFGLIGPDGAGKTTLLRLLVGLLEADSGSARVGGYDVKADLYRIKEIIGYMPQRFSLYQDLTVEENFRFYGDLFQVPAAERRTRQERLLGFSRLGPFRDRRAGALSGGMKQKLALSCTLIHTPRILFLDEPTTGVDPVSRREFWDLIGQLNRDGITVLVSTAYMDEAARCNRVGLMFGGKLMAVEKPEKMPDLYPCRMLEVKLDDPVSRLGLVESLPGVCSVQVFGDRLHVGVKEVEQTVGDIERALREKGVESFSIRAIQPGIEDVFVELIRTWQAGKGGRGNG
jgi:ABC-2 type transport system ATP-binding protein